MAESRLIGSYPVIGIRPTIDGRRGKIKVRESLEDQTMNMAKSAAKLIEENVFYSNGEHAKVIIADTTIGRVAEAAACEDKFKKAGVDAEIDRLDGIEHAFILFDYIYDNAYVLENLNRLMKKIKDLFARL